VTFVKMQVRGDEIRRCDDVVVDKEYDLPAHRGDAGVAAARQSRVGLAHYVERTGGTQPRDHRLVAAVVRAVVDKHDLVGVFG
jgi:hypothetical protein